MGYQASGISPGCRGRSSTASTSRSKCPPSNASASDRRPGNGPAPTCAWRWSGRVPQPRNGSHHTDGRATRRHRASGCANTRRARPSNWSTAHWRTIGSVCAARTGRCVWPGRWPTWKDSPPPVPNRCIRASC